MKKAILFSRESCQKITFGLFLTALLLPLLKSSWRSSVLTYAAMASLTLFVTGVAASIAVDRVIISRLRIRFPEWKKEIEKFGFLRIFRAKHQDPEKVLQHYIKKDPDCEQIAEELQISKIYSTIWVYFPMTILVGFILYYAFAG